MRGWTIRWAPATVLLAAVVAAASATAAGLGPTTRVTVKPGSGTPQTRFAFSFRVPEALGTSGSLARSDTLSVSGPRGGHCQARVTKTIGGAKKGKRVKLTMRPAKGRGGWCQGQWHGTVVEHSFIRCNPSPVRACPDLVVAPRVIASFKFRVKPAATHGAPAPAPGDVPTFGGLISAVRCPSPQPVRAPRLVPRAGGYTLTWTAATDPVTPSSQLVYEIFVASSPGGEDYATPTYATSPGVTSFLTPGVPPSGTQYFVVRARNAAGHEDANTVEKQGIIECPPLNRPARRSSH
ncbi:MAG TPA: hypothetical protein VHW96_13885 [Solirubrobacteraceae bacterium]|jgi:hypothetical protein|nr:hypothetical protein [Solirubrobacteraceae bacterium]